MNTILSLLLILVSSPQERPRSFVITPTGVHWPEFRQVTPTLFAWATEGEDVLHFLRFRPVNLKESQQILPAPFLGFSSASSGGVAAVIGKSGSRRALVIQAWAIKSPCVLSKRRLSATCEPPPRTNSAKEL